MDEAPQEKAPQDEIKPSRLQELAAMHLPRGHGILSSPMAGAFRNDKRIADDTMRQEYRELSDLEKEQVKRFKSLGEHFLTACDEAGGSREIALAKTKMEEAVMWATKAITR